MLAKSFLPTLAAAAVLASGATAFAEPPAQSAPDPDVATATVFVGDLNLNNHMGAVIALHRIEVKAASVCGDTPDWRRLEQGGAYNGCVRQAVDHAVATMHSPALQALLNGHSAAPSVLAANH